MQRCLIDLLRSTLLKVSKIVYVLLLLGLFVRMVLNFCLGHLMVASSV